MSQREVPEGGDEILKERASSSIENRPLTRMR
jgi:hypothetical protein